MANYNRVILMGNLTRDPEMSYLPSQTAVVEIGLAVNRRWKSQDGQQREETCFIDCRAYGRQAETLNQYMSKGRPILIEGRLQFDQWEGKDGTRRSKQRVIIDNFQFLGGGGERSGGGRGSAPQDRSDRQAPPPSDDNQAFAPPDADDIPF
jgi:single-strand DNA-binding protein